MPSKWLVSFLCISGLANSIIKGIYNNSLSVEKYTTFDWLSRLSTAENVTFPLLLYILIKHTNLYFGHTFLTQNIN